MDGFAVDAGRVHHDGEGAGHDLSAERLEIFLANLLLGQISGRTVLARPGSAVTHIVLGTCGHVVFAYLVGIRSLVTLYLRHGHAGVYQRVLAEAFPDAGPAGIATQVGDGVVDPGTVGGAALVSGDACHLAGQFGVERRGKVDGLREHDAPLHVGHAMVVVKTIDGWDADILHRQLLDGRNPVLPLFERAGVRTGSVQERSGLPFLYHGVETCLVEGPFRCARAPVRMAEHVKVQLEHLAHFLVQVHLLQGGLYLLFDFRISRNGRTGQQHSGACQHRGQHYCPDKFHVAMFGD